MNESSDGTVDRQDIHDLLEHFSKTTHKVKTGDWKGDTINETCQMLIAKDYKYSVLTNFNGELCAHYPSKIILMEYEVHDGHENYQHVESIYNMSKLQDLCKQARFARCRSRFVVPVILYAGKNICRSATLASGAEMYGRSGFDFFFSGGESIPTGSTSAQTEPGDWQLFDRFRGQDKKLLKSLKVGYICDLMVEKKKVKFGMNITSSEKVDKENRYVDFTILCAPYPGCEFFKEWKDKAHTGEAMWYNWNQDFNDALLDIPVTPLLSQVPVDWNRYKEWDLIHLTQNYLKLLLHIIREGDSGLLVHCISGWDRTPLFISLLRLSLWADGVVHRTLTPAEILYLTLGYDWYLFGHNLADRLSKGEEIMFFCFSFLKHIVSEDFSIQTRKRRISAASRRVSESANEFRRTRRVSSESNMPVGGVLLDGVCQPGYKGSNTSINSTSSSEMGVLFFVPGNHDDDFVVNENPCYVPKTLTKNVQSSLSCDRFVQPRNSPSSRSCDGSGQPKCSGNSLFDESTQSYFSPSTSSSSPMAVPRISRYGDPAQTHSPSLGSWQIISSSGSLRAFACTNESPYTSSGKSSNSSHVSFNSCNEATEPPEHRTLRMHKLESVSRLFQSAYSDCSVSRVGAEASGLSSLLDQFAEKVGIKKSSSTVV